MDNTKPLSGVLKEMIKTNKLTYGIQKIEVRNAWHSLMGEPIWKYTTKVELKGDTLFVELSSPALRQELGYGKEKIIKMLNEELSDEVISKLVFR